MKAHKDELKELSRFPKSWRHGNGFTYSRLALETISISAQEALGWYEVLDIPVTLGYNEKATKDPLIFTGTIIEQTYSVSYIFTPEELIVNARNTAKVQRAESVQAITVTVDSMVFDGDEISQGRMARAVVASDPLETVPWTLANDVPTLVTREQLKRALRLAGDAQTAMWAT